MRALAALAFTLFLAHAPDALAAAGGGSGGFGGGGGGGGGGGYGGGSGGGGQTTSTGGFIIVLIVVGAIAFFALAGVLAERRRRRRRNERDKRVRAAAVEAAQDDQAFAPERVAAEAEQLFRTVQEAWTARDTATLASLCGPDLMVEWQRRLDDFASRGWHNTVSVDGEPHVYYVGLVNREGDADDRVCVLVEATLTDVVVDSNGNRITRKDSESATTQLKEYWTLSKRDGRWTLHSIEQLAEGEHNIDSPIVASPWADERVRDTAVLESAAEDAAGTPAEVAALADLDYAGDGRKAALDLSLVDGRFGPDVLETCAKRAVEAWAEAIDGEDAALLAVASPAAVAELLYPRGGTTLRRVVRGPRVEKMTLVRLNAEATPPAMEVELALSGRRYVEDRDTTDVVEGSRERAARWTERWTFALGTGDIPWTIAASAAVSAPR